MYEKYEILVIGDSCEDIYVYGICDRLCPDAPVPVFIPKKEIIVKGMSGNVHANLKALGAKVTHITQTSNIIKKRYVHEKTNQMIIRIDEGEENVERIYDVSKIPFKNYDAIIISDYNKGFLTESDIDYISRNHDNTFIDTKKIIDKYCESARFIKINEMEYKLSKDNIKRHGFYENLIVTVGSRGTEYKGKLFPVDKVDMKDQTGAGDTFIAALVCKYLDSNGDIEESIKFANKCASFVVTQKGVVSLNLNKI